MISSTRSPLAIIKFISLICLFALTSSSSATAQTVGLDTICWISTPADTSQTIGSYFNVLTPISVTELDILGVVLYPLVSDPVSVGLWDSTGALLASAIISTSNPAVLSSSTSGNLLYGTPISPLTLGAGQYVIGAFENATDNSIYTPTEDVVLDPALQFVGFGLSTSSSLVRPELVTTDYTYFGPTFKFSSAVPEPGIALFFGGLAVAGGLVLRRRKNR